DETTQELLVAGAAKRLHFQEFDNRLQAAAGRVLRHAAFPKTNWPSQIIVPAGAFLARGDELRRRPSPSEEAGADLLSPTPEGITPRGTKPVSGGDNRGNALQCPLPAVGTQSAQTHNPSPPGPENAVRPPCPGASSLNCPRPDMTEIGRGCSVTVPSGRDATQPGTPR